ncbi:MULTISPECIES: hypothetical protein [Haloferacaceae]|jgi:hypothetical protein|uniref:hypothetical protein n=1 Tax=Haloferacaceae TaxID=1644056 RepID=UPI000679DE7E|nr:MULTISPECIES: hypothetical protein [Haloferacales]
MSESDPTDDRWIDAHSVTCAICGYLADERETKNLYKDDDIHLEGEAHWDCWETHDCLEGGWLIRDPGLDVEADIDPQSETVSLPAVCKVCGKVYRMCYDFAALYDPEADTFEVPVQIDDNIQGLLNTVNRLANNGQIDPEEAQYLRDNIIAIKDRLGQHRSRE